MKTWKLMLVALPLMAGPATALAQTSEAEARARAMELEEAERVEALREAEARLAEYAARVAELSTRNLPEIIRMEERIVNVTGRPRLGITIATDQKKSGPVEGVRIIGVTPGSAAADAGLRSGDILTAVDSESMSASSQPEANKRLMGVMRAVDEGDKLDVEYLRDGNVGKVTVEPRVMDNNVFVFATPDGVDVPTDIHVDPNVLGTSSFAFRFGGSGWADMELVELNEGLGRYFGTSEGLLVVNAPESEAFQLEDGDVIQSIDGREPQSVGHAIRILSSYQPGEKLELSIMRDKRRRTLEVELPDDRRSLVFPRAPRPPLAPPAPMTAPVPAVAPTPHAAPLPPQPAAAPLAPVVVETTT